MKAIRKILIALLLGAMAAQTLACGQTPPSGSDTTPSSGDTTVGEDPEAGYPYYGTTNFGGETFTIYNCPKNVWGMTTVLNPEDLTGETVNDAIYNRNEFVKEKLNFELNEVFAADGTNGMLPHLQSVLMANEDVYDAAYMPMQTAAYTGITEGYFQKLDDISALHLNEDWWDRALLESTRIAGTNYFATSAFHLMSWDGVWCIFFNETMLDNLGGEMPYDLVRQGKWTLEEFSKYCKLAANLNGDSDFTFREEGKAVYGSVTFNTGEQKFVYGVGVDLVSKDEDELPIFSADSERNITALQKLATVLGAEGEYFHGVSDSAKPNYYQTVFEKQRALFLGAELKTAQLLRNMEQTFGILPFPKVDETQENYRSSSVGNLSVVTIPMTNAEPEKIGLILDAMSYESDARVLEPYFSVQVEQKGLRNENSIDMLNIIKGTVAYDIGLAYSWASKLSSALLSAVISGNGEVAGVIESYKSQVETLIEDSLDAFTD